MTWWSRRCRRRAGLDGDPAGDGRGVPFLLGRQYVFDQVLPELGGARVLPELGVAVGRRRGRVRVLDQDDGVLAGLVDVVAQVGVIQSWLRLVEDEGSDVVTAAAHVLPAPR